MKGVARFGPRTRASMLLVLVLAVFGACTKQIPREDWGAITRDATITATTVDGTRYRLEGVTVFEQEMVGLAVETGESVTLALDQVEFVETRGDATLPIIAALATTVAAIGIITAMGKSNVRPPATQNSCPFIYSFDGSTYTLDSETYAGAITRGVQRTDLDNLEHLRPVDGEYRLLLTNERPETQYTDAVTLVAIDHPSGSSVYPDVTGQPHVFASGAAPTSAQKLRGGDAMEDVAALDERYWLGDPIETADLDVPSELRDGLVLTFPKTHEARALLAVRAQNTGLAPFALKTFLELQGDELVDWYRRVDHDAATREKLRGWFMREGTLHVSVWVDGAWQMQDVLLDVGPHLPKTQVARLDVSAVEGDEVRIRLESARGLWTLDWVSLGVELEAEAPPTRLTPTTATLASGRDLTSELSSVDGAYFTALEGDRAELTFNAPPEPAKGFDRSVMVESTGFYHIYTDHAGAPQHELTERILTEPLFGNRYILGLLRSAEVDAGAR